MNALRRRGVFAVHRKLSAAFPAILASIAPLLLIVFIGLITSTGSGSDLDAPADTSQVTQSTAAPVPLAWPLDIKPALTSSFAEYRSGHFHAGIDLSTFGREGVPVRAVADGEVVRVRASAVGYGRAVYTRLEDGRLAVYAHLQSVMEPLADYVEERQHRLGRYRVDLYPESGRFRLKRGQVLGRSGSSGAGGPHLHFEMREGDSPINPLTHGLAVADEKPPVLLALVFTPLAATARVDGEAVKQRVRLTGDGRGAFAAAAEVRIGGRVGVGIEAFDRAGRRDSRLGLHRAELQVDGDRVFAVQFERFDYSYTHEVEVEFDYEQAVAGRRPALNLFVPSGIVGDYHGDLPAGSGILNGGGPSGGRNEAGNRGIVALLPGLHTLRVVATDASGNQSTASATLRVEAPAPSDNAYAGRPGALQTGDLQTGAPASDPALARASAPESDPDPRVHLSSAARVATLEVDFASPPSSPPALLLAGLPLAEIASVAPGRYAARIDARGQGPLIVRSNGADGGPRDLRIDLPWLPVPRGEAGSFAALGDRVRIDFPVRAFFEDACLWVEEEPNPPDLPPGLTAVSPVYRVEPAGLPLNRALWVGIELAPTAAGGSVPFWVEHVALYHLDRDEIDFAGREQRGPSMIGAAVRHLGRLLLARDHRPPELRLLSPADSTVVQGGRPLLRATVRDRESGFFEDDVTFLIDGRRVPTEWNPEAHDMRYRPPAPLSPGSHRIVAQATDRAGLKIERAITISVP